MEYYEKFVGSVTISHYLDDEESLDPSRAAYQVTLHNAWPITMNAIEMTWESAEIQDFQVDINYSWWTASGESASSGQKKSGQKSRTDLRNRYVNRSTSSRTTRKTSATIVGGGKFSKAQIDEFRGT